MANWSLNETTGSVAKERKGERNGTLINMENGDWVAGKIGNALSFDGVNEEVVATGYKGILGTNPRTITAWIKADSTVADKVIAYWGTNSSGQKNSFRVQDDHGTANTIRFEVNSGYVVGSTDVLDDAWHHVAVTWEDDGTPNVLDANLYVDGVLEAQSASLSAAMNTVSGSDVKIGRDDVGKFFDGIIDDVRIYDRALSAAEISGLSTLRV